MLQILGITAPIFILIGLGYLFTRNGVVSRDQVSGMGRFVISLAMPALVINALSQKPLYEAFDRNYLLAYGIASLAMLVVGMLIARFLRKDSVSGSALSGLGMSVSNSAFIGYPIVSMVVGEPAALALTLGMMVENMLMFPLVLIIAEFGGERSGTVWQSILASLKRLASNPIIIAIFVGMTLSLLELRLPAIPRKVIEMLAMASAPVALFVIGGNLFGLKVGGMVGDVLLVSLGKLVLHPLAVMACFWLLPVNDPALRVAGILFACCPMMSIYPIIGQRFGLQGRCAAALVGATLLSFVTISAFIGIVHF
ncbi:AEC family transporter [Pseudomonas sp. LRF_L74]|uniref:AEC family transporter n=1 Tax=Pseudomonas sp. LRF_L74 TaxID=3369422 RepID=UPI003F5E8628